DKEA
ncbi:hypothetical protein CP082626L3_1066B, partial [Chlamydia psittaci 08-2626_L3]